LDRELPHQITHGEFTMKTICRRLQKLEKTFAPAVAAGIGWGSMAGLRDKLLRLSGHQGAAAGAKLRTELDALGPTGLWRETARDYLRDHGFVQQANESFAETMARALGIGIQELKAHLMQGSIGKVLLERFTEPTIATDI
jgi:hypothetical protein